eukprot:TRINITY_DN6556_c0_g1_i1.p1 TRINITY_DN6556_c0_g1~~TRINITY_DN6556_c0_g1_i1.p1  ORF type:complete len:250 (-),score=40.53 TRINITY_DN6556_c0_g1_i1:40-789(-)
MRISADMILRAPCYLNPVLERQLDLRGKMIPAIENLGATQDQNDVIDLTDNEIAKLENFPILLRLKVLYVNNNHISKIAQSLGDSLPELHTLILSNNRLTSLADLDPLVDLPALQHLSLVDNVVTKKPNYRLYVINKLPHLKILDFKKIKQAERTESTKLFGPPVGEKKKRKKRSQLEQEQDKQRRTFVPGEPMETTTTTSTDAPSAKNVVDGKLAIQVAIENAKTMEEVQRVERMIRSGTVTDVTMTE